MLTQSLGARLSPAIFGSIAQISLDPEARCWPAPNDLLRMCPVSKRGHCYGLATGRSAHQSGGVRLGRKSTLTHHQADTAN
jgi:hypothetical protein